MGYDYAIFPTNLGRDLSNKEMKFQIREQFRYKLLRII